MRQKKRWLLATTLLLNLVLLLSGCEASTSSKEISVESQTSDFYVNDFAKIFSEEQKSSLMENAVSFDEKTGGIQIVITTVESLQNHSVEDYAHAMYNQYGIGRNNMGALILFSTGDRKVRIEVGNNMEQYLTDSISGRLMDDNSMDHFRNNEFDIGLIKLQKAVIDHVASNVPENWNADLVESEPAVVTDNEIPEPIDQPQSAPNNEKTDSSQETNPSGHIGIFGGILALLASLAYAIKEAFSSRKYRRLYEAQKADFARLEHDSAELLEAAKNDAKRNADSQKQQYQKVIQDLKQQSKESIHQKDSEIQCLRNSLTESKQQIHSLESDLSAAQEKFSRAIRLYPNIEAEIAEQIQQEFRDEAILLDQKLSEITCQTPDKDKVSLFRDALSLFSNASSGVKQYSKTDVTVLKKLCHESEELLKEYERKQKEIADKAAASKVEEQLKTLTSKYSQGSHTNYDELAEIHWRYESLSSTQKSFVSKTVLNSFLSLFVASEKDLKLYQGAKEAEKQISGIIGHMYTAHENDRDKLKRAMNYYRSIPHDQLKYFDSSIYDNLRRLIQQAENDHEEQERKRRRKREEEERRRRQAMSSSYNSFGSHSSGGFGGHGGMSSGGGASRGF